MGKKKEDVEVLDVVQVIPKEGPVDLKSSVQLKVTNSPFHKEGETIKVAPAVAEKMKANGWAVALTLALLFVASITNAQLYSLYNSGTTHTLPRLLASTVTRDTVTNTGVGVLGTKKIFGPGSITIWVAVTKVSGTVGGTLTLQGSMDGVNFKAINTPETQTALATVTATDASNTYHWRLNSGSFIYYRVSWTGTGTMVAYMDAQVLKH